VAAGTAPPLENSCIASMPLIKARRMKSKAGEGLYKKMHTDGHIALFLDPQSEIKSERKYSEGYGNRTKKL
jgi:hypothetical protein